MSGVSVRDGRELVASVLYELPYGSVPRLSVEPKHRPTAVGLSSIVLGYLTTLREWHSGPLYAGFIAAMTDFTAATTGGAVPSAEWYEAPIDAR
jgi:hypothetical protein